MYIRYYDDRFGDLYEVYLNDLTGDFEGALRSIDVIGRQPIFYSTLGEIPTVQRHSIEQLILARWEKKVKDPSK